MCSSQDKSVSFDWAITRAIELYNDRSNQKIVDSLTLTGLGYFFNLKFLFEIRRFSKYFPSKLPNWHIFISFFSRFSCLQSLNTIEVSFLPSLTLWYWDFEHIYRWKFQIINWKKKHFCLLRRIDMYNGTLIKIRMYVIKGYNAYLSN